MPAMRARNEQKVNPKPWKIEELLSPHHLYWNYSHTLKEDGRVEDHIETWIQNDSCQDHGSSYICNSVNDLPICKSCNKFSLAKILSNFYCQNEPSSGLFVFAVITVRASLPDSRTVCSFIYFVKRGKIWQDTVTFIGLYTYHSRSRYITWVIKT